MKITRLLSCGFLIAAVTLVGYGLFGLSRFTWYTGEYYDERMVLFDHGFYPFSWGIALLVIGQVARLHHRLPAMLAAGGASLLLFVWKRATVPGDVVGQRLFPDPGLLDTLIVTAVVVVVLALIDRPIERAMRNTFRRIE